MFRTATLPIQPVSLYMLSSDKEQIQIPTQRKEAAHQKYSDEHHLNQLFEQVILLPAEERPAFLDVHCINQPDLRTKIETLLIGSDKTPPHDFLDPSSVLPLLRKLSSEIDPKRENNKARNKI